MPRERAALRPVTVGRIEGLFHSSPFEQVSFAALLARPDERSVRAFAAQTCVRGPGRLGQRKTLARRPGVMASRNAE